MAKDLMDIAVSKFMADSSARPDFTLTSLCNTAVAKLNRHLSVVNAALHLSNAWLLLRT